MEIPKSERRQTAGKGPSPAAKQESRRVFGEGRQSPRQQKRGREAPPRKKRVGTLTVLAAVVMGYESDFIRQRVAGGGF